MRLPTTFVFVLAYGAFQVHCFDIPLNRHRWRTARPVDISRRETSTDYDLATTRQPHQLANGRGVFLGFRNAKDVRGIRSSVEPLMPDGGLSPCVIRVLGVGGGGCNAVGVVVHWLWLSPFLFK